MGDNRGDLGDSDRRPSMVSLPALTASQTSGSQILSATPGKRAARVGERTAAERANAAATSYVGRRMASCPIDAPSGTIAALLPTSTRPTATPVGASTLEGVRARVDYSAISRMADPLGDPLTDRLALPRSLAGPRHTAPMPPRDSALLDTGTINAVLVGLEPVDHSTSFADDVTEQLPLLISTRPPRSERLEGSAAVGKRRATRHTGRRGPLFRSLPSAPLLLGVAALAVSAGGAITASGAQLTPTSRDSTHHASALAGTSGVGTAGLSRGGVTSRDSARGTLDAASGGTTVDPVEEKAAQRSGAIQATRQKAEAFAAVIEENQWQTPLDSYRLTARFGQYGLWANYHTGLDFAAPSGTPIHSIANGVVTSAGYDGSYGNKTVVTLDDGTELWYGHQTSFAVSVGDTVRGGETIGYVGSTGNVTGPHVHIEVRPGGGDPVDPYPAFIEHGVTP